MISNPPHTEDDFDADIRPQQAEQLSLFVNLEGFEGPIDLLLSLSREQKSISARLRFCHSPNNISTSSARRGVSIWKLRRIIW